MSSEPEPAYWLRQRAGDPEENAVRLNAAEAAMIAQRPDAVGDHLAQGLIWQEPDGDAYTGSAFYTLTPVYETTGER